MDDEGKPLVEDDTLRDVTDLYSELQSEIIWLQGEIAKITDDNPCKPALITMLESLEKMWMMYAESMRHQLACRMMCREFEEPRVDLTFDLIQRWPSYIGLEVTTCPDMALVVSQPHDFVTSPLGVEVMIYPIMASVPESVLGSQTHDPMTSPLGLEDAGIDGHQVIRRWS
eukprot:Gb_28307 [translate_table: standard]